MANNPTGTAGLNFVYGARVPIVYGSGRASDIAAHMPWAGGGEQILAIVDPGILNTDAVLKLFSSLEAAGYEVNCFDKVRSDPTEHDIDEAADLIRTVSPDVVIGVGGGSALDTAKLAASVAADASGAGSYALMAHPLPERLTRLVMLPTTAGTGAEVTRTAVFTDGRGCKTWTWGEAMLPDVAILDPLLTLTLPPHLTAATGLDAMVHAIEACTNRDTHPFIHALGLHAVRMVRLNLQEAIKRPDDLNVRGGLLMASTLAGMAIDGAGTALAHGMGHALCTVAGVHHGRAVALALNAMFPENAKAAPKIHARIARALGVRDRGDTAIELALKGARAYHDLILQTGMDISLQNDGLSVKDLDRLMDAVGSEENKPICEKNCYLPSEKEMRNLFHRLLSQ